MKSRRMAIGAVAVAGALGTGVAFAAMHDGDNQVEDAILSDAADRLDVEETDLRNALSDAQADQIDKAVENGDLSKDDAERIKQHIEESGHVLGMPLGPRPPLPMPMAGGPLGPEVFEAIADELGIPVERLHRQLLAGKSMRKIANANGKSLADVKDAAQAAIEKELTEAVDDGRISKDDADRIRDDLPEILSRLVRGPRIRRAPVPPPPMEFGPPPGERWHYGQMR